MSEVASSQAPASAHVAAPLWRCSIDQLQNDPGGASLDALTVGAKFRLDCNGDLPVAWDVQQPVTVQLPDPNQQKYDLKILQTLSLEPQMAKFVVTSYRAGEFSPEYVRIFTGKAGFETTGLRWQVQSVLPKDRKPEAYPAFGPYLINMPFWVWFVIFVAVLFVVGAIYRLVRRYQQRKKVQQILKDHASALPPHTQFHREMRQIKKAIDSQQSTIGIALKLDSEVRLYLLRTFQMPALDWSDREILKELKRKRRSLYDSERARVAKALRELTQLKKSDSVKTQDLEQMFVLSRDTVDRLERLGGILK